MQLRKHCPPVRTTCLSGLTPAVTRKFPSILHLRVPCIEGRLVIHTKLDHPIVTDFSPMNFRVDLNIFRGPLDLLLFLVRKHEIETPEIPIALITEQFLEYLTVLEEIDIDGVGDFLEMATTLMEIKSRMVLPREGEENEVIDDPRDELVKRLLEYKNYRDVASLLDDQSREWQQRYARQANDLPPRRVDSADQPIREVELWDLVSVFGRIMRDTQTTQPSNIVYDDTPIQHYMRKIHLRLVEDQKMAFSEMFQPGMHKSVMIGIFLAILELVRHHKVLAHQPDAHGDIEIEQAEGFSEKINLPDEDAYQQGTIDESTLPSRPR